MNFLRLITLLTMLLGLGACQVDLYTQLSEQEANTMLSLLLENGISADKSNVGDGLVTLLVDEADLQQAVTILNANGLPKREHETLGQVFQKSGIISSPFEERIRFVYALSEEVSKTINEIDGIVSSRVHIVLPEKAELGEEVKPSSAAIFIKHRPEFDIEFLIPQIKRLVSNAIEGVEYANVSVALVPARDLTLRRIQASNELDTIFGLRVAKGDVSMIWTIILTVAGLCVLLLGGLGFVMFKLRKSGNATKPDGDDGALSEEMA